MKKKSAHYRQCQWLQDESLVLRRVLDDTYNNIATEEGFADFDLGDGLRCFVRRHDVGRNQSFFHFVTYERDSRAAVVSIVDTEIDEADPPEDSEFVESQIFLLIRGDHVLYTTHNKSVRDGSINAVLGVFVGQNFGEPETQFLLRPKFNREELRRVYRQGIDHIDLGVGSFKQTVESVQHDGRIEEGNILSGLADFLGTITSQKMIAQLRKLKQNWCFGPVAIGASGA